jgi:hypothetical protein
MKMLQGRFERFQPAVAGGCLAMLLLGCKAQKPAVSEAPKRPANELATGELNYITVGKKKYWKLPESGRAAAFEWRLLPLDTTFLRVVKEEHAELPPAPPPPNVENYTPGPPDREYIVTFEAKKTGRDTVRAVFYHTTKHRAADTTFVVIEAVTQEPRSSQ